MIRTILAGALLCAAVPAAASEWWAVSNNDRHVFFMDAATMKRDGDKVSAWEEGWELKSSPRGISKPYHRATARNVWNCVERTYVALSSNTFNVAGNVIESWNATSNADTQIAPDSVADNLLSFVCALRTERNKFGYETQSYKQSYFELYFDLMTLMPRKNNMSQMTSLAFQDSTAYNLELFNEFVPVVQRAKVRELFAKYRNNPK